MTIPYYEVLAFTQRQFAGNPAGVCLLEGEWLPDALMQSIGAENNLAETAFIIDRRDYLDIRWMSPSVEIELCGHATLASAHVLFNHLNRKGNAIRFQSRDCGELRVDRKDGRLILDFLSEPAIRCEAPKELSQGLRAEPQEIFRGRDYLAVFEKEEDIAAIQPDSEIVRATRHAWRHRDRAGKRLRLRFTLFRACCRHSGRFGHRISALRAHSILVETTWQTRILCAPDFQSAAANYFAKTAANASALVGMRLHILKERLT